ncbi:xanthine dehydrogenase accessory protein XdhC [Pseudaquabacterium rugosum]|uniref:Xanthine dehydrogenase accessory protein XdhC n=1 Tax=Pseudaquabacterium rugosum TaxID=2984194 RepID=A0ABU9BG92_9BURK
MPVAGADADAGFPAPQDPLHAQARQWLAAGRAAVLVQVLQARGSVPRGAGTRMLVAADALAGTIGGGHLEWRATAAARALLARRADPDPDQDQDPMPGPGPAGAGAGAGAGAAASASASATSTSTSTSTDADGWQRLPLALGPSLGQCCGGAVTLGLRPLDAATLAAWPATEAPRLRLQLHGAGHVGTALVRLLQALPLAVQWVDERPGAFDESPAGTLLQALAAARSAAGPDDPCALQPLASDDAVAEVAAAPPGCVYLVMTHDHALDERLVEAVLRRGDARWLGLIGSASKRARFEHRLQGRGLDTRPLVCPVGLPGIDGKEPAVIAVAIAAQLLALAPD